MSLGACGADTESDTLDGWAAGSKILRVALPGSLSTLDVNQEAGVFNYYVASIVQEGLVSISDDGSIEPALAESWEDEDATVWRFKIREDAKFQDGTPVTADDVVYCVQRASDPILSPATSVYFPSYLNDVEKTGEYEVTITLDGAHTGFLWSVSNTGGLFVTSRAFTESAETVGSPQDLILGSGPYRVVEFEAGSHVIFKRVDTWWGGIPGIGTVRVDFFEDDGARFSAFQRGETDFTINVPMEDAEQWAAVEGAALKFLPDRSYHGITFDTSIEPFDDIHVRRAIAYAVDRETVVNDLLGGHGQVATAISSPEQFSALLDSETAAERLSEVFHHDYDMAKAKEELALSKVPDGFSATITYPNSYKNVGKVSRHIAGELSELGIDLEVKEISLVQWLSEVGDGNQGMAWMIYVPTSAEPAEITSWLLDARGMSTNPANWYNGKVAEITARVNETSSLSEQIDLIIESNSIAQEEVIYIPVYWGHAAIAFGKGVSAEEYNSYTLLTKWPLVFDVPENE
jgi:peptide/nickel transport system substrate-binding protein